MDVKQKGLGDLTQMIGQSGKSLSIAAGVIALGALVMPFIGFKTNIGFADRTANLDAFSAAPMLAGLTLLAFAVAAASRFVTALFTYRNLSDFAAWFAALLCVISAWFFNPIKAQADQVSDVFHGVAPGVKAAHFYPHVGMIILLVACGALYLARRKGS